jgi:hypothetical protein
MFVAGLGPLASGEGAAVEQANNGLIKLAAEITEEANGVLALPALKRKHVLGYSLDDEEALGYLLGDSVEYNLEPDGARKVSKRASKHLKKYIKKRLPEVASAARAQAKKAGSCPDRAAEAARTALLLEPFDLKCHLHPRREPPQQPPPKERKRKRAASEEVDPRWHHFAGGVYVPWSVAADAVIASSTGIAAAEGVLQAAVSVAEGADSARARAEEALEETPLAIYLNLSASEQGRVDARKVRAWETYNAAWQAHADAMAAVQALSDALGCSIELSERMEAWMARPHCLTPFPRPGGEYVVPCNQVDLNYYLCHPNAYPPGVQEWLARFQAHIAPCLSFHHEIDTCDGCCPPCQLCELDPCVCD